MNVKTRSTDPVSTLVGIDIGKEAIGETMLLPSAPTAQLFTINCATLNHQLPQQHHQLFQHAVN